MPGHAGETSHLHETEEIRQNRLPTPVLVDATRVQSVAAATGFRVNQRRLEIVAAQEPIESTHGMGFPVGIAIGTPCGKTGRDARGRLEGLLIEWTRLPAKITETLGAHRPEDSVFRGL
jgi:hypothetical protein